MNKLIIFIALAAFGAISVGMLTNNVTLAPQEMGVFPSTTLLNDFECSCEDPNNPGTFGSQFCSTTSSLCP